MSFTKRVLAAVAFVCALGVAAFASDAQWFDIHLFQGPANGSTLGNGDNSMFSVAPPGMSVSGASSGILSTARILPITYTGSGSPTVSEATSLYIDGAPTLTGITGTPWAIHVNSGNVFLGANLLVFAGGAGFSVNSAGVYSSSGDFGMAAPLNSASATTGFMYIPTTGNAGAPTGTPAGLGFRSGATAMVYDDANDRLYVYDHNTATWKIH